MNIRINFLGGPANGGKGTTDSLDSVKLIFDTEERQVYAYPRLYDTEYLYDPTLSEQLSEKFEETYKTYDGTTVGMLRKEDV